MKKRIYFKKSYLSIVLIFLLYGCGCRMCKEIKDVDLGPIPDSTLNKVPYRTGQSLRFENREGVAIEY
ncbi:MAG TPA: hypothetical protein VF691_13955, partial [Cytophagaceae bacterium]